ncbi:MAG: tRNA 2-thiouridine(34) synthase MnmA [Proteobacteria bacterium]|nr:tRNA 2-thiouridine(34) synthase MnmA [Pseudomonadota bacterium]
MIQGKKGKKVAVAMSGGVDSSAAALILKREGYDVIGVSMKLWEGVEGGKGRCCSLEDFQDARRVAEVLDIPYYVVNMQEEFSKRVVDLFVSDYIAGKTPNPCVLCNQEMKFDLLLKKAAELGADYLATGHYIIKTYDEQSGRYMLSKGKDPLKDQSYFLFSMTQDQLSRVLFPLGEYDKPAIRILLKEAGIRIADKAESQDICFVDDSGYSTFVNSRVDEAAIRTGNIISSDGEILGRHDGIHNFTIGQRRGLGISSSQRLYVVGFDYAKNDVILGKPEELMSTGLVAERVSWVSIAGIEGATRVLVKIRYSTDEHPATLSMSNENGVQIVFDEPQRAVTPGQAVVFYDGATVLGGGWIKRAIK